MPWTCYQCGESLRDDYLVCWKCGSDKAGNTDPHFPLPEVEPQPMPMVAQIRKAHRSWIWLIAAAVIVVIGLIVLLLVPPWVSLVVLIILGANLFALVFAWFVTWVLRIPNDGSIRWEDNKESSSK